VRWLALRAGRRKDRCFRCSNEDENPSGHPAAMLVRLSRRAPSLPTFTHICCWSLLVDDVELHRQGCAPDHSHLKTSRLSSSEPDGLT
jgi:hypothetical protein